MSRHGLNALVPAVAAAAKTHYGTSLANVDWLHGSAESLLTITNLLIGEGTCSAALSASMSCAGTVLCSIIHQRTCVQGRMSSMCCTSELK